MQTLLQISWRVSQWKNYENRPTSDEVIVKIKRCSFFWDTVCITRRPFFVYSVNAISDDRQYELNWIPYSLISCYRNVCGHIIHPPPPSKNCHFLWVIRSCGSLPLPNIPTQLAPRSVEPLLQGSRFCPADIQMLGPYICATNNILCCAWRCGLIIKF